MEVYDHAAIPDAPEWDVMRELMAAATVAMRGATADMLRSGRPVAWIGQCPAGTVRGDVSTRMAWTVRAETSYLAR